jgi:hypothetical protein
VIFCIGGTNLLIRPTPNQQYERMSIRHTIQVDPYPQCFPQVPFSYLGWVGFCLRYRRTNRLKASDYRLSTNPLHSVERPLYPNCSSVRLYGRYVIDY